MKESQGRNRRQESEAGSKAEAMEEGWLVAHLTMTYSACFVMQFRSSCPGWFHPEWPGLSCIKHRLRTCTTDSPTGQSDIGIFSIGVLMPSDPCLSQVDKELAKQ